jgi:uncharacterized surface protein with fasciclin (FAS1) repeats
LSHYSERESTEKRPSILTYHTVEQEIKETDDAKSAQINNRAKKTISAQDER